MWIADQVYGVKNLSGLVEKGVLTRRQRSELERAGNFLWALRFHLHLETGRAEEKLTYDKQVILAERQGYTDLPRAGQLAVERFMMAYFRVTKSVGLYSDFLLAEIERRHKPKSFWARLPFAKRRFGRT